MAQELTTKVTGNETAQELTELMNLPSNYGESLTPKMKETIQNLVSSIDITNRDFVTNYGAEQQTTLGKFADAMLSGRSSKEFGEAGDLLNQAINEISGYNSTLGEKKKGFFGIKTNPKKRMKQILDNYKTVDQKIELIAKQLLEKKVAVSKVYDDFDALFEANKETYMFLTTIVYAGEIALDQAEEKLEVMKQDINIDPQDIRDFSDNINRFCNRLTDLKKTRYIAITLAPQIRSVQKSADQISDEVQTLINTSIPVWKTELALALGIKTVESTTNILNQAHDLTNQLILNISEEGKNLAIESAKASQRGILDIETARQVNKNIIDGIIESTKITQEGTENSKREGKELRELQNILAKVIRDVK